MKTKTIFIWNKNRNISERHSFLRSRFHLYHLYQRFLLFCTLKQGINKENSKMVLEFGPKSLTVLQLGQKIEQTTA